MKSVLTPFAADFRQATSNENGLEELSLRARYFVLMLDQTTGNRLDELLGGRPD